jgi:CspA family cold shock protein
MFNSSKGFGLISPDEGGTALFAAASDIRSPGVKNLKVRQRVEYAVRESSTGELSAASIRVLA